KIGSCCISLKRENTHTVMSVLSFYVAEQRDMRQRNLPVRPLRYLRERFAVSFNVLLPLRDLQFLTMLD
ncbi:MAG: hypothetical protein IJQ66_06970, partial [Clostridia bacterium]|nr:hypothetical protein [Clostridia bacterium]